MKKTPLRMCISCREMKDKRELIRFVKNSENVIKLDKKGKCAGRGAYVCDKPECIKKCCKVKMLNKTFSMSVEDSVYKSLVEEYENGQGQN